MLIGISGLKNSGKNTVANIIQEIHPQTEQFAWADKVKEATLILNPYLIIFDEYEPSSLLSEVTHHGWDKVKQCPEVRQFVQHLGTDVGRKMFGEDVWINALLPQISHHRDRIVLITDVRFENELQTIIGLGGFNIQVTRPGHISDGHDSEQELPPYYFDHLLRNDSSLPELSVDVTNIMRKEFNLNLI
jgi:hypothetical protein